MASRRRIKCVSNLCQETMSRPKIRNIRTRACETSAKNPPVGSAGRMDAQEIAGRENYVERFLLAALFAFGAYQSVLYFGCKVVPNPDFTVIARTGRELLSFQVPSSFKYAPVVGLLQAALSHLVGGQHPELAAGWLLNAILHPFSLVLLWLVGKKIVGASALWFAFIVIINHWVIYMLTDPIIETPLLFFSLATLYLILKRSNWSYVLASITTMVRYEGLALILAAFIMDLITVTDRRRRIRAFLYAALATIPLALWLLGTFLTWKPGTTHYLEVLFTKEYAKGFAQSVEERTGILMHMRLLWMVGFRPLLMPYPGAGEASAEMLVKLNETVALAGFFFGSIYGLLKRRWEILILLLFFVPYFLLHAFYPYPLQRFHSIIFWLAILLCLFGLQAAWRLVDGNGRVPRPLVSLFQAAIALIAVIWLASLVPYMSKESAVSPKSVSLPYVAIALAAVIFAARLYVYKAGYLLREISILAFVGLVIVSNQSTVVRLVGDGQQDKEFKLLADWFIANAKPGEKMAVYMVSVVKIFAPKHADSIVLLPKADSPDQFVKTCRDQNITYVVWATREGLRSDHTGYRQLNLHETIKDLADPKSTESWQFVGQVGSQRGYVNIFRLRPAPGEANITRPPPVPP